MNFQNCVDAPDKCNYFTETTTSRHTRAASILQLQLERTHMQTKQTATQIGADQWESGKDHLILQGWQAARQGQPADDTMPWHWQTGYRLWRAQEQWRTHYATAPLSWERQS